MCVYIGLKSNMNGPPMKSNTMYMNWRHFRTSYVNVYGFHTEGIYEWECLSNSSGTTVPNCTL